MAIPSGADWQSRNRKFAASRICSRPVRRPFSSGQLYNKRGSEIDGKDQGDAQTASAFLLSANPARDCVFHHCRAAAVQHAAVPFLLPLSGKRRLHHDPQSGRLSIGKPGLAVERIYEPLRQDRQRRPALPHRLFAKPRLRPQRAERLRPLLLQIRRPDHLLSRRRIPVDRRRHLQGRGRLFKRDRSGRPAAGAAGNHAALCAQHGALWCKHGAIQSGVRLSQQPQQLCAVSAQPQHHPKPAEPGRPGRQRARHSGRQRRPPVCRLRAGGGRAAVHRRHLPARHRNSALRAARRLLSAHGRQPALRHPHVHAQSGARSI